LRRIAERGLIAPAALAREWHSRLEASPIPLARPAARKENSLAALDAEGVNRMNKRRSFARDFLPSPPPSARINGSMEKDGSQEIRSTDYDISRRSYRSCDEARLISQWQRKADERSAWAIFRSCLSLGNYVRALGDLACTHRSTRSRARARSRPARSLVAGISRPYLSPM